MKNTEEFAAQVSLWKGAIRVNVPADKQTDLTPRTFTDMVRRVYGNPKMGYEVSLDLTPWIVPLSWIELLPDERTTMGLNATDPMGLNSTTDMGLR